MSKPRSRRRRRVHLDIGRARMEPEPEIDVEIGRARIEPERYPNQLYDYGPIDPPDDTMHGGSVQTSDGHQFHEAMDIQARPRRGR